MKIKRIAAFATAIIMATAMVGCGNNAGKTTTATKTEGGKTTTATKTEVGEKTQEAAKVDVTKSENINAELTDLAHDGKLVIGYTNFAPLNYNNSKDELIGFETDFAKAVCAKLGIEAEFTEIDWDSKEIELSSKAIDCVWNGMTITDERKANMSISIPYMENRQVLVVRSEDADKYKDSVDGANIVAEAGSAGEELAMGDDSFKNASFTAVESQATALMEVKSGTADVAIIDFVMAGSSVGEGTSYADLAVIDNAYESEEYGIAFRKNSDLTEAVNAAIKELAEDGTLGIIAEHYGLEDLILVK